MSTPAPSTKTAELQLAHSPDSDDAFMFYALATGKVRLPGVKFTHMLIGHRVAEPGRARSKPTTLRQ